jgi:hypothetical protein
MIRNHPNTEAVWRLPIAFQVVFILLTFATIFFLPESPRYLYTQGHTDDADDIMARIYSVPVNSIEVAKQRSDVLTALEAEKEYNFTWKNLFYDDSPVRTTWRLWLGVLVQFFQQMDGSVTSNLVMSPGLQLTYLKKQHRVVLRVSGGSAHRSTILFSPACAWRPLVRLLAS